jgi:uncharacterized protein with GYD domain
MPTFILMTKLGPNALETSDKRKKMGREWLEKVKKLVPGVRFVGHYAIFGPYDFMDIYEAPDDESAQRVALISRSEGAVSVETWQALPYDRFLKLLDRID